MKVLDLVSQSRCSAYDCEYVALAHDLNTKLITADKEILKYFTETAFAPKAFLGRG